MLSESFPAHWSRFGVGDATVQFSLSSPGEEIKRLQEVQRI